MTHWIITSSLLILAVLIIRTLGRDRLSARLRYALWGLVLLRLLCPVSIGESALSVQNLLPEDVQQTQISETYEPSETIQTGEMTQMPQMPQTPQTSVIPEETSHISYPMVIWVMGMVLVGAAFLVSNVRFYLRLRRSRQQVMHRHVPVYASAAVETPCLFGFPMPAVYITPAVMEDELALEHVLAHELTHYRHFDHLWALLRCVCVTLHWYNPLVWAAAFLSQKDGELACDEGALRHLGDHERTAYAKTLLDMTCVGYKGMLTAATSMTGSESDLKTRVLRIVKNPKMPVWAGAAVLLIAAVAAIALFTGAKSSTLEGVWRLEMSYLGGDTEGPATAYMEYEFGDSRGVRTDHIGGELRSAEWFNYTVDGETMRIWFDEDEEAMEYTYALEGDTLTMTQTHREMTMTRVDYAPLPFLDEGLLDVMRVDENVSGSFLNLTDVESAQLVQLLRKGEITVVKGYGKNGIPFGDYQYSVHTGQGAFTIAEGVIVGERNDSEDGYVLSNIDEIVAWLEAREWINARAYRSNGISALPEPTEGAVNIAWGSPARRYYMVPPNQTAWRDAVDLAKAVGVPDGSDMTIIERMDFGLYADGQHWYFDTDGTCYIAGAELYIAPEYTVTLMKMLQPYVDVISPDVGATLPNAGTTHYVLWNGLEGSTLRFVDGDTMEKLGIAIWESMSESKSGEGIEFDEGYYKLFGERLGIEGREIMISDRGELVIDWEQHYDLFEPEELLYLLSELFTEENSMITDGLLPGDIDGIASAALVLRGQPYPADSARLAFLEELLSEAEPLGYPSSCPFGGSLELTMADGRILRVEPALDSCAVFKIGEEYYEYGNKFETADSGSYGNEELLGIFGVDYKVIEKMFTVVEENEGGLAEDGNAGDVIRVRNGQSDSATVTMTDETRETLFALLTEGIYEPVEENAEVTCEEYAYELLCGGDYGFPDLVTVSDNGSVYIDGLRYEPENYTEIWALLDGGNVSLPTIHEADLEAAVQLARSDYEAWKDEEWCLSMEVLDAVVHEEESARFREMYEGFEEGWTGDYLAENFVAVRVTYKCELDHNKIFYPDGEIVKDTLLVRADRDADWEIWDYSPEISIDPPDGRGESEVA